MIKIKKLCSVHWSLLVLLGLNSCANTGKGEESKVHPVKDRSMLGIAEIPSENSLESNTQKNDTLVNALSEEEKNKGWKLLFDGESSNGWRNAYKEDFPEKGWDIRNGELIVLASGGAKSRNGGDIVTTAEYSDFDLRLQVLITKGANSGVKYFVTEAKKWHSGSAIGLEYQILDDENHPDAKLGNHAMSRTFASLYDLIPATNKQLNSPGQWNNIRILSKGNRVEHWLNGLKVLEYERGSKEFRRLVSESKYKKYRHFGEVGSGHILLQDHGDEVHFRSIKINTQIK